MTVKDSADLVIKSSTLTLETAVSRTSSAQGPFCCCCRDFNHIILCVIRSRAPDQLLNGEIVWPTAAFKGQQQRKKVELKQTLAVPRKSVQKVTSVEVQSKNGEKSLSPNYTGILGHNHCCTCVSQLMFVIFHQGSIKFYVTSPLSV